MARKQKVQPNISTIPEPRVVEEPTQDQFAEQPATLPAAIQETQTVQPTLQPHYPEWPHSKPGPRKTPPPPGMQPTHRYRPEQMTEVGYNQETGEPGVDSPARSLPDASLKGQTSFDQQETVLDALGKRKKRL